MNGLKHKIERVLNDERKLDDFTLYFRAVMDQRCLTTVNMKEILVRVSSYVDRTMYVPYKYEEGEVLLVVNVMKIEKICDVVLENSSLSFSLTLQEFKDKS